jgi:protein-S-isoprenylcysteine O-methyltransferase Ste14
VRTLIHQGTSSGSFYLLLDGEADIEVDGNVKPPLRAGSFFTSSRLEFHMQRKARLVAAAGSAMFFGVAPGVVAGLIPWWLTGWRVETPLAVWGPVRVLGAVLTSCAALVLISAFARFAIEGVGTPAPVAPTRQLVIGGLYRYVRNPMYIAVVAAIAGQAFLLGQLVLLLYGAVVGLIMAAFVRWFEEPTLLERFGGEYLEYRQAVPGWWPRLRPRKRK